MIDRQNIPTHVAIIMDGNGRWAQKVGKIRTFGHKFGTQTVKTAMKYCKKNGIKHLTLYAFSTENWKRPQLEVDTLMSLITEYLTKETPEMKENGVKLNFIGDLSKLPKKALASIDYALRETSSNTDLIVNIALNYGGRAEIINACNEFMKANPNEELSEEKLSELLYTKGQPDPDLLIRTGGEQRLSNFLLWQCAYTEFYYTNTLWPDFDDEAFDCAIEYYQNRDRRFGGLN